MKLFIVTCLKEYQDDVTKIFKEANIHAFSATEVMGFNDKQPLNLIDEWFASGDEKFGSVMLFSFTGARNAGYGMELIRKYNKESGTDFPVRAIIVAVENASF